MKMRLSIDYLMRIMDEIDKRNTEDIDDHYLANDFENDCIIIEFEKPKKDEDVTEDDIFDIEYIARYETTIFFNLHP